MKRKTLVLASGAVVLGLIGVLLIRALEAVRQLVRWRFLNVTQISTAELATWLGNVRREPPLLLDAREVSEYAVSHLPGAIRVDPRSSSDEVITQLPSNRGVVLYCSAGYRSAALAERLRTAGRTDIANLDGSIFKWANEGRPLVRDGEPTREVHPYSAVIGWLMLKAARRAKIP